jgi:GxxExxY protein
LEKVYENAMYIELIKLGLLVERQVRIKVHYNGEEIGDYFADLVVNKSVIIELKALDALCEEHAYQLANYLKATKIEVGLLLNFGKKPEIKRKIFDNQFKKSIKIH